MTTPRTKRNPWEARSRRAFTTLSAVVRTIVRSAAFYLVVAFPLMLLHTALVAHGPVPYEWAGLLLFVLFEFVAGLAAGAGALRSKDIDRVGGFAAWAATTGPLVVIVSVDIGFGAPGPAWKDLMLVGLIVAAGIQVGYRWVLRRALRPPRVQ